LNSRAHIGTREHRSADTMKKHVFIYLALMALAGGLLPEPAAGLQAGQRAPAFEVCYESSRVLRSSDLAGSVIIITCESRETREINNPFKDALLQAFPAEARRRHKIAIVPVVSCFEYPWPIKGICARRVQDSARALGLQLYVDISGKMFQDYGADSDTSTVIIIDREGVVRYVMRGKIPGEQVGSVVELVRRLAENR
jgi:predicted transcriptional regulator